MRRRDLLIGSGLAIVSRSALGQMISGLPPPRPVFDYYIDSTDGNDANSGSSANLAKATLASIALVDSLRIKLSPSSFLREEENTGTHFDVLLSGASVGQSLPAITVFNLIIPASWSLANGFSNTYTTTVVHNFVDTLQSLIVENDVIMTRVSSSAGVEETPGSWYCPDDGNFSSRNPYTVYYHPSDSSDPRVNGKTVEANARDQGLRDFLATSTSAEGVYFRGCGGDRGCCVDGGADLTMKRCLLTHGGKHHIVFASGLIEDCVAVLFDPTWLDANAAFTAYRPFNATDLSVALVRCIGVGNAGQLLSHTSDNTTFGRETIDQCILTNMSVAGTVTSVSNSYSYGTTGSAIALNEPNASLTVARCCLQNFQASAIQVGTTLGSPAVKLKVTQTALWIGVANIGSRFIVNAGANSPADISNLTVAEGNFASGFAVMAGGSLRLNNSLIVIGLFYQFVQAVSFTGDNNVYVMVGSGNSEFNLNGTNYVNNFAGWQAATGQDANSKLFQVASLAEIFSGNPSTGDFRINSSTVVGQAITERSSGVQEHWDFNRRSVVVTPPTRWPVGPSTLAEAKIYVQNPPAWNFYP